MQKTSNIIRLNVGGVQFVTSRSTLDKNSSSFFTGLLSGKMALETVDDAIFIDRSGPKFAVILEFMRTNELHVPAQFTLHEILSEAEFYLLDDLIQHIKTRLAHEAALEVDLNASRVRMDGYYTVAPEHASKKLLFSCIAFIDSDRVVLSKGESAEHNLIIFRRANPIPQIWNGNIPASFAKFCMQFVFRGKYWLEDDNKVKVQATNDEAHNLYGLFLQNDLFLASAVQGHNELAPEFVRFEFKQYAHT